MIRRTLTAILCLFSNLIFAQNIYFEEFPFKEATAIQLVSFSYLDPIDRIGKWQSCFTMPKKKDGSVLDVDLSKIDKIKTLSLQQAAMLYEIAIEEMTCPEYESSNDCIRVNSGYGILFRNDQNEIFAVIDFCFECNFWSRYPGGTFEPICPKKLELISMFFHDNGFQ